MNTTQGFANEKASSLIAGTATDVTTGPAVSKRFMVYPGDRIFEIRDGQPGTVVAIVQSSVAPFQYWFEHLFTSKLRITTLSGTSGTIQAVYE